MGETPADPVHAKELLKGMKSVPKHLMRRLERVVRKENGPDGEGWKCGICLEGWEGVDEDLPELEIMGGEEDEEVLSSDGEGVEVAEPLPAGQDGQSGTVKNGKDRVKEKKNVHPRKEKSGIKVLPCNHFFHRECLEPWFERKHTW